MDENCKGPEKNKRTRIPLAVLVLMVLTVLASVGAAAMVLRGHGSSFAFMFVLAGLFAACCEYALWDVIGVRGWRIWHSNAATTIVALLFVSLVTGFIVEAVTLAGSRIGSVLDINDWHFRRAAVYTCLAFIFISCLLWFRVGHESNVRVFGEVRDFLKKVRLWEWVASIAVIVVAVFFAFASQLVFGLSFKTMVMLLAAVALVVDAFLFTRNVLGDHPEYLAASIVLFMGCVMVFAPPAETGLSWDDQIHYARTVNLSFLTDVETTLAEEQLRFPPGETTTDVNRVMVDDKNLVFTQGQVDEYEQTLNRVSSELEVTTTGESFDDISYSSFGYVPFAVGMWLMRAIGAPLSVQIEVSKLFSLLFYAWCVFMAVRITPARKNVFAVVLLCPGMLFLASAFTYDTWEMGLLALVVALIVRECKSPALLTKRTAVGIILLFVFALGPKPIYFPLLGLLFLLPKSKFKTNAQRRFFVAAVCAVAFVLLASFAAPFIASSGGNATDIRGGSEVNASEQLQFILHEPVRALSILFAHMVTAFFPNSVTGSLITFSYVGTLYTAWRYVGIAILLLVALTDPSGTKGFMVRFNGAAWVFVIVLIITLLMELALYISFTPVREVAIAGLQGRYFFPLMVPLLCFCIPVLAKLPISKNQYSGAVLLWCTFFVSYAEFTLFASRIIA